MIYNIGKTPMPSNFGESIRRNIEAEANQEDDGGFFARLGGLEPDPDADGPTAKGLFQQMSRNNDENRADCHTPWENQYNKIPGHTGHGLTADEYLELEKRRREGMKIVANYIRKKYGRKPIVKVRSDEWGDAEGVYTVWLWECQICVKMGWTPNWRSAQQLANHHARNHQE